MTTMPDIVLPVYSLPLALAFWGVYLWAFYIAEAGVISHTKQTRGDGPARAQDSLASLMLLTLAAKVSALLLAWFGIGIVSTGAVLPAFVAGLALMLGGSMLRRHCFKLLGASFTVEVRASADQPLVAAGAYRYLRHPAYLAGLLMLLGFGLSTASYVSAGLMLVTGFVVYARRIRFEEAALIDAMGERYRAYSATRKKIIPFIY